MDTKIFYLYKIKLPDRTIKSFNDLQIILLFFVTYYHIIKNTLKSMNLYSCASFKRANE